MSPPLPTESATLPAAEGPAGALGLVEALLDAALQAQRAGSLHELVRDHPRAARWLVRRHLQRVCSSLGEPVGAASLPRAAGVLLRWLVTQLRPDGQVGFEGIDEQAWLSLSSWRPMLATSSHAGLLRIPDFPRQYRRRPGEAPLDNLCGLWGVGPSTVYRTLERARHMMAAVLREPEPGALRLLSLRGQAADEALAQAGLTAPEAQRDWHRLRALDCQAAKDPVSELWHRWRAGDATGFALLLQQQAGALIAAPETEALVERMAARNLSPREQVDLWMARAALARAVNASERELKAYEQARAVAQSAESPLLLGMVHGALGKYYEPRDGDRAFACYQDSAEFLRDLGPQSGDLQALEQFVTTYARLAWLYVLRNDARSKVVLDRAEALRSQFRVPDHVLGMLEQVWGLYWRRNGDLARSLEHRHRALNIFERLGDERSVLAACVNIGFDLAARGDHARAADYAHRVLEAARRSHVDAEVVFSAHVNLGASHFWRGDHDAAIQGYETALRHSLDCGLRLQVFRARYNLAEAHYTRFRERGDPADEAAGDSYIRDALAAPESDSSPAAIESARELKGKVLGEGAAAAEPNRMLPGEDAVHLAEMSAVHRQRAVLAVPGDAEQHARAHLAIARAYLAISTKEREAALALIDRHGLQARFTAELAELHQTFQRELTREQQLAAAWKQAVPDLVDDARRPVLVAHLLREGAINKSGYAELCGVSPATASKHLAQLTDRGLLVQQGKGPSTRYTLPG